MQVAYPASAQTSVQAILDIPIRARNGSLIRVGDIATLVQDPVERIVTRTNRQTVIHLSANVAPGYALSAVQKAARARFAALHLPDTVSIIPAAGFQQANLSQTIAGMGVALALSLLLVYLLMLGPLRQLPDSFHRDVRGAGRSGRRDRRTGAHAANAQPVLAHRHHPADRTRIEERHSARGFREQPHSCWHSPRRRRSARARTNASARSS